MQSDKSKFMCEPRAEPSLLELCRGEARNRINSNLSVSFVIYRSTHIFALKTQRYAPHSYQRPALFAPSQHHDCSQGGATCHRQDGTIYRRFREMLEQREQNIKLVLSVMPSRDSIALYEMAHRQHRVRDGLLFHLRPPGPVNRKIEEQRERR